VFLRDTPRSELVRSLIRETVGDMVVVVLVMVLCVVAGAVVLGYVAAEARRESREFWTPEGEQLIADMRRRGGELRHRGDDWRHRTMAHVGRPKGHDESA
jgi:hypothetical protein